MQSLEALRARHPDNLTGLSGAQHADLLILAYYFPPQNESGARRPFRFARYLAPLGIGSHVITASDPKEDRPWPWTSYVENPAGKSWSEMHGWNRIAKAVQRALPYNDQLEWVPGAFSACASILRRERVQAVLSTSPPLATHFVAWALKQRFGVRWIADLRDPIRNNPFRPGFTATVYSAAVERLVVASADVVIANTDAAGTLLCKRYPKHAHKIQVIWNGYDPEERLHPLPVPERPHRLLLHAGSLYGDRHPGMLMRSLDRLIRKGFIAQTGVRVRLIGYIDRQHSWIHDCDFERLCQEGWVECKDSVPSAIARAEMASSDYLLLLDLNEQGSGLQVPGKLFEYIQVGRPVLAFTTPGSPSERILSQSGTPHVCIYQNAPEDEVDRRVMEFFALRPDPVDPSEWFNQQFDAAIQASTVADVICPGGKPHGTR